MSSLPAGDCDISLQLQRRMSLVRHSCLMQPPQCVNAGSIANPSEDWLPWANDLEIRVLTGTKRASQSRAEVGSIRHLHYHCPSIASSVTFSVVNDLETDLGGSSQSWQEESALDSRAASLRFIPMRCMYSVD